VTCGRQLERGWGGEKQASWEEDDERADGEPEGYVRKREDKFETTNEKTILNEGVLLVRLHGNDLLRLGLRPVALAVKNVRLGALVLVILVVVAEREWVEVSLLSWPGAQASQRGNLLDRLAQHDSLGGEEKREGGEDNTADQEWLQPRELVEVGVSGRDVDARVL
jgi:hypothetical protein